ncbi:branched-chain amino acid ABC transporter ATP-binding protein/permease [Aeromicrobium wangtongii]|uniref:Branched-chain amino acid ABC transporter ATP-binding protein/permease n=1 Tax=Aeromicrobium wangtongii TaxID=2969247 RepID=A0ABY5MAL4_9ACTN|nr:branched-chain amino acid ABC transporter ATP-binding protein/permease [Aeromicrobium wangtongii]MCD9197673.1 branched-chain amino acid ABC transporter ATP-binding protein/permease [Aeromicrobium wangtongii]UUP15158.1 branched-chain amino acid ABC transporter ATP-binding protein/permease [Aeromicrobium wangtongii]
MSDNLTALRRDLLRRDALVLVVALALAAFAILPGLGGDPLTISRSQSMGSIGVALVAACGLNLLAGHAGLISLGQGAFVAIGAYVSAWALLETGLPWPLALILAVAASAAVGAVLSLAAARLSGPQVAMITLAFAVMVHRLFVELEIFGRLAGYPNTSNHDTSLLDPIKIGGTALEPPLFAGTGPLVMLLVGLIAVLSFLAYRNLAESAWGRSLRALATNEIVASHIGINPRGRKTAVFTVAATFGGVAGTMQTQLQAHLQPESFTFTLSLNLIIMVILGGAGRLYGPVVGVFVLMTLEHSHAMQSIVEFQQENLSDTWFLSEEGLTGLLLILTLVFLPSGLVGGAQKLWRRFRTRNTPAGAQPDAESLDIDATVRATAQRQASCAIDLDEHDEVMQLRDVTHNFAGLKAVDDMQLTLREGTIHALVGPNGAGKTTLVNLTTGVYPLQAGATAHILGKHANGLPPHAIYQLGVARTFQTPQLFHGESALVNVMSGLDAKLGQSFIATLLRLPKVRRLEAEARHRAMELLERLGIEEHAGTPAGELPYGLQRSVELARALASDPKILILDEPAAGLNPSETYQLGTTLEAIAATGVAILLVEHDMSLVIRVADEVTCMERGARIYHGDAAGLQQDQRVLAAYLGDGHVTIQGKGSRNA